MRLKNEQARLLTTLAAVPATAQLSAQAATNFRFRAGLVAYSYRKELAAKSLSYEDLIRRIADWGLDGLDCTAYWFPDTSPEYLASLRKAAYKNGIQIYNAGVRVQLSQPTGRVAASRSRQHTKVGRRGGPDWRQPYARLWR